MKNEMEIDNKLTELWNSVKDERNPLWFIYAIAQINILRWILEEDE